jgi:hypothetical protein
MHAADETVVKSELERTRGRARVSVLGVRGFSLVQAFFLSYKKKRKV